MKEQLGIIINTRDMTISLPPAKITRLQNLLQKTWHPKRKTFTLLEGTVLLGFLEHAAQICPWGRYLYCCLRYSVNLCLKQVLKSVHNRRDVQAMMAESRDSPSDDERILKEKFHQRKIAKTIYNSKLPYFISKELRSELDLLQHI